MVKRNEDSLDVPREPTALSVSHGGWDKHWATVTFVVVTALVYSPSLIARTLWTENGRSLSDVVVFILLPIVQIYLMLLCPVMLIRAKPRLAAFDCQWFRWDRSEVKGFFVLLLGIYLISAAATPLIYFFSISNRASLALHNDNHGIVFWAFILIYGVVLGPISEEVLWRGYAQSTLTRSFGPSIGVLGQAVLFGLTHIAPPLLVIETFLTGLLFGLWRHRRGTLLPLILVHMGINATYQACKWLDLEERLRPARAARYDTAQTAPPLAHALKLNTSNGTGLPQQALSWATLAQSSGQAKHTGPSPIRAEPLLLGDIPFDFKDCRLGPASSPTSVGTCRRQFPRSPPASSHGRL